MTLNTSQSQRPLAGSHRHLRNGLKYHYRERSGTEPTLLLLHGYVDSSFSFDALLDALTLPVRSFSPDFRGHGESDAAEDYAVSDLASDTIEFIEQIIDRPVIIVGHSLGSIVAQRVAALRPDLVQKLILIGAAPTAANHPGLVDLRAELQKFEKIVPLPFIEDFQRSTVHAPIPETTILRYIHESSKVGIGAWQGALRGLVDEPEGSARLITLPTLVIWGAHDGVFGAESQAALASLLPGHRAVRYDDAGHAPHWEFPERVARDVEAFIEGE